MDYYDAYCKGLCSDCERDEIICKEEFKCMREGKTLFNFYLDDDVKIKAQAKISRLIGDQPKGQLSALIRVLLKQFVATPDEKTNPLLMEAIAAEYEYSAKCNKRSRL